MISSRPTIPLLVHEDCMDDIKTDLADQQAILYDIESNTSAIRTSSSNTATTTSSLNSAVGTTTDASTSNTVIGLLKSIANKL